MAVRPPVLPGARETRGEAAGPSAADGADGLEVTFRDDLPVADDGRERTTEHGPDVPLPAARHGRPAVAPAPGNLSHEQKVRRSVSLLLMSLVVPGSAQVVAGHRRAGLLAVKVWAGLLGALLVAGLLWVADRPLLVGVVAQPAVLTLLGLLCVAAALGTAALLVDAWRLGRPGDLPLTTRRWVAGGTALLVLVTSVPLVMAGRRLWAAADLVGGVFAGGGSAEATDGRFNVLLLGGDAGADRVGVRPDSVTLASIDAKTGRTVLFSLPRNLQNVPFPAGTPAAKALPHGWSCGDTCLLNAIYTWGSEHRALFPGARDAGAEAMKQAVSATLGLKVNYYVLIDLKGFAGLVDALGGIDLSVTERVPIGGGTSKVHGWIEPGRQHLDGYHALWYARSRHGTSDYDRMARQRCVMTAMVHQLDPATVLARFQGIAAAGKQVVSTDVPPSMLGTLVDLALHARSQPIRSVQFVPPLVQPAHPDLAVVRGRVRDAVEASRKAPAATGTHAPSASPAAPVASPTARPTGPTRRPAAPGTASGKASGAVPGAVFTGIDRPVDAVGGTDVDAVCTA